MRALPFFIAATVLSTGCPVRTPYPGGNDGGNSDRQPGVGGAWGGDAGGARWPSPRIRSPSLLPRRSSTPTARSHSLWPPVSRRQAQSLWSRWAPPAPRDAETQPPPRPSPGTPTASARAVGVTAQLPTNGSTATSNAITVVVDRTPPQVVLSSLVPAIGAGNVVLAAPIQASFSEPVLGSTVTPAAIPIQTASGTTLPTTVALSSDGKTATIQITSSHGTFTLGQAFNGSFTNAITDLAGSSSNSRWRPLGEEVPA